MAVKNAHCCSCYGENCQGKWAVGSIPVGKSKFKNFQSRVLISNFQKLSSVNPQFPATNFQLPTAYQCRLLKPLTLCYSVDALWPSVE
jgi:hypothetical protein